MTADASSPRTAEDIRRQCNERLDRVQPSALAAEVDAGAMVVDIRPVEQRTRDGELPGALVIDRNVLEWRLDPASEWRIPEADDYDRRIILVCNEGWASALAACTLRDIGLHRATDLVGGYQAWASVSQASSAQNSKPASLA